jgi:multiple sugar transport system substrate-binding protein
MSRRFAIVLVAVLALITACSNSGQGTASPGVSGASQSAGSPGASESGGSPGASESGESPASSGGTADISGPLQVGGKYGCSPAPCEPDQEQEGVADEIAYVRYNVFAEQYPDVELSFTEQDFDSTTFLTAVAAGNPPDVIRMDRAALGTYVAQGALEPLDQCISNMGIDMSQYREPAVQGVTMNGQVYGIPEFYDSRIILINDSVLEEVGLTPEDIDTSDWDKLSQINEQLMAKDGDQITRIGFDPKLPEFLPLWAKANGASIVSEDGTESLLDDPKVAEALDYAASLIKAHGTAADFLDFRNTGPGSAFFGPENQFTEDSVGAFPMEQWYLNVLAGDTPDEKISFQPFRDRQGNNISMSGGSAWAIPTGAKNPDAACEFMRVITLPDSWYAAAKTRADQRAADGEAFTGVYTGNKLADERIFGELVTEESAGAYYEGVQLVLETSDVAFSLPPIAGAEAFDKAWKDAVQRVLNEDVPAAEALAQADQEAQDAIDSGSQ